MSLRRRVALAFTAIVALVAALFATISLAVLDRTLRAELDAKLTTLALAVGEIADVHQGVLSVDARDVRQIKRLLGTDEHVAVLDRHGRIVYGETVPAAQQRAGYRFARTTKIDMTTAGFGTIVAWQSDRWIADVRRASLLTFTLVGVALLLLAAFCSRAFANAILDPVERIAGLAERIEAQDLSTRIHAAGSDELSRLCASFDRMLDRLEASFETERRFVADASHELRTPLAVVRAETDLALRRERSGEEYRNALESIDRETTVLEGLVDQLLGTMREAALVTNEPVDLTALLESLAARFRTNAEIRVAETGAARIVRGHAPSIERALTAVLHNAITHGASSVIDVRICAEAAFVRIEIQDAGPGFGTDALVHATERFWRADSARSRGGTGLGLAVARMLVEAHGGEVRLANGSERGAVVSLVLPQTAYSESSRDLQAAPAR